jgi:hypothetical protein
MPALAKRFLLGFATSLFKHFLELFLRLIIGAAFIVAAPHLLFPFIFNLFDWVITVTTVCLALIHWRLHRRFAAYAVPKAVEYISLIGLSSLGLGVFILICVFLESTT